MQELRVTSAAARRVGRAADPFRPHPTAPILARLPLLPVDGGDAEDLLAEGVFLASRRLRPQDPASDRTRRSLRAYELRARWRPTPHGVFAGVALAEAVDGPAALSVGRRHRARTNPSSAWLAQFCENLLDGTSPDDAFVRRLTLTVDATAVRRGDRWEVEAPPVHDGGPVRRSTVRATAVTDQIMTECRNGASTESLVAAACSRWPQATEPLVLKAIKTLIGHGLLLTSLSSVYLSEDPIGQLLDVLPSCHPASKDLLELRRTLGTADAHTPGHADRRAALGTARDLADRICRVERPLTVDVAVDCGIGVPAGLIAAAVEAAGLLWQIAPAHDPAAAFHQRFIERYGHHRYVPLLEAADPVTGIGNDVAGDAAAGHRDERTAVLSGLVAEALARGVIEVELDDGVVAALSGREKVPPQSADVYVRLVADNEAAAVDGRLRPVVVGCVPTAGSTLGRFASLFGHHHTEPGDDHAVIAELSVRSRSVAAQTVARTTGFAEYRIPVGLPATSSRDLRLENLLLVADGAHTAIWSQELNRQVLPVLYSRLSPRLLPPIARLLYTLGQSGTTPWHNWSWDALADTPFLPRITYHGAILSPARWTLPSALVKAADDVGRWNIELDRWRTGTLPAPPATCVTEDADRQLPLTLDHADDRELLRRYVRRGLTSVAEPPGGPYATGAVATGLRGRHVVELVIPVIRQATPDKAGLRAPRPVIRARGAGLFHPGGPWLSLAIPTAPHLQDDVLLLVGDLAQRMAGYWDSWFWLRYRTSALGHHVRIRFQGRPELLGGHVLPAVADLTAAMSEQNLASRMTVECYEQEIERYGGTDAIGLAEQVFDADSRLVLTMLQEETDDRVTAAAQVAATITRTVANGDLSALAGRHLQPAARQTMNRLRPRVRAADAAGDDERGPSRRELFSVLLDKLAAYRDVVPVEQRSACASSLVHMHANRIMSAGDEEPLIRALAADLISRRP